MNERYGKTTRAVAEAVSAAQSGADAVYVCRYEQEAKQIRNGLAEKYPRTTVDTLSIGDGTLRVVSSHAASNAIVGSRCVVFVDHAVLIREWPGT